MSTDVQSDPAVEMEGPATSPAETQLSTTSLADPLADPLADDGGDSVQFYLAGVPAFPG